MLHWIYFVTLIIVMYVCIATIGRFTGGEATSVLGSVKNLFTPLLLALMLISNMLFAVGIYYGFIVSTNALPISIAIGVGASFLYSVVTLGVVVTTPNMLGLGCILLGIYLLR